MRMRKISTREKDLYKIKQTINNNYHMIRFYQPNVWDNVINWKQNINDTINKIKTCYQNNTLLECFSQNKNIYNWININLPKLPHIL